MTHQTFVEWEKTIDKNNPVLEIPHENHSKHGFEWETSQVTFPDGTLVLADYPNLTRLDAHNCGLKAVAIINCPNLEVLILNHNKIEEITGLDELTNLTMLEVTGNSLTSLDLERLVNLQSLYVAWNKLTELEVRHCTKLINLLCFNNKLAELDCSGLTSIVTMDASVNSLRRIILESCSNLENLDIDFNYLDNLDFSHLKKLKSISVRANNVIGKLRDGYWETMLFLEQMEGKPPRSDGNIKFLRHNHNFLYQGNGTELILNSPFLRMVDYKFSDVTEVIHQIPFNEPNKIREIDNKSDEGYLSDEEHNNQGDKPTEWEQLAYERHQAAQQQAFAAGQHVWAGQVCLDLSGRDYIKSIEIDGQKNYPQSLESINLGDNYLEEVIVRNMPNLRQLIISHNKIKKLVIENCPQLDQSLLYQYKSGDQSRSAPTQAREYNEETDNPSKQAERQKKQEEDKILGQIIKLIAQAEQALARGDLEEATQCLAQLQELATQPNPLIDAAKLNATIADLENRLNLAKNSQINQSESVVPTKLIIGSAITVGLLGIIGLITDWFKKKNKL